MKPDWGHGPNEPVMMFSEAEIRAVMAEHFPQPSETMWCGGCIKRSAQQAGRIEDFTVDHLLEKLKEGRAGGRLHPAFD